MLETLSHEYLLLVGAIVILAGILAGNIGSKFGVPALLLFLATGIFFGVDGIGIHFDNMEVTQFFGTIALSIILFNGGMDTKIKDIRPIMSSGLVLSTLGVLLTTLFFALFIYGMSSIGGDGTKAVPFTFALLLAATMSSTDSASVFALLKGKNLHLKEGIKPILELESGSNDPMAYMLTIAMIQFLTNDSGADTSIWSIILNFVLQFSVGALAGLILAKISVWLLNKAKIDNSSLYPILLLSMVFLAFSLSTILGGNGYLTVYIMGIFVGNRKVVHKQSTETFFDGITWLVQINLFILLGLLVNPHEMIDVAIYALPAALFMIFVARPLAVFISLSLNRNLSYKAKLFISWVGLRGAVPIIFATYPMVKGIEGSSALFNIVFFITLFSLLLQGSSIAFVAKKLGLDETIEESKSLFGVEIPKHTGAKMEERKVSKEMLSHGNKLMNLDLRDNELVILVKRGDNYIVPKGQLELQYNDVLLIVSEEFTESRLASQNLKNALSKKVSSLKKDCK